MRVAQRLLHKAGLHNKRNGAFPLSRSHTRFASGNVNLSCPNPHTSPILQLQSRHTCITDSRQEHVSQQKGMTNSKTETAGHPNATPFRARTKSSRPDTEGRGLRLSWPYGSWHRRAIVSKGLLPNGVLHIQDTRILHTSNEDIQRHKYFAKASSEKSTQPAQT